MNKQVMRFMMIAAILVLLVYMAAPKLGRATTMIIMIVPLCFFVATIVTSIMQVMKRRDIWVHAIIIILSVAAFAATLPALKMSDRGLQELTQKRIQTLSWIRPAFLRYQEKTGTFPKTIHDLVPDYIQQIPPELLNKRKDDTYTKIVYESINEKEARFIFFRSRNADSRIIYSIKDNTYKEN